jgi:hypothetical protein
MRVCVCGGGVLKSMIFRKHMCVCVRGGGWMYSRHMLRCRQALTWHALKQDGQVGKNTACN